MKKIISAMLCLAMLLSLSTTAFAYTGNQVIQEPTITSDKFIDPALVGTTIPGEIMPLDDYNEVPVVAGTYTTYKTVYVTPTGQPSLGYTGGSSGIVFFFDYGGSSSKFTITVNGVNVSLTAETGKVSSSGSGYGASVPSASGKYRFDFKKDYTIKSKKIDVYQYNTYKYTYYTHDPQYSLGHRWVKI